MADTTATEEVERAITQALAKNGVGGTVVVRDEQCELHAGGTPIAIELGDWVGQWNLLPDDVKEKRAEKAATRLTNAVRQSQGKAGVVAAADRLAQLKRIGLYIGVVGGGVLLVWWLRSAGFFGQPTPNSDTSAESISPDAGAPAVDPSARVMRACDAARQRIFQGAALGIDIEGFVVELWLARDSGAFAGDEALAALLHKGFVADIGTDGPTELALHAGPTELGLHTAIIQFDGAYVTQFFEARGRERFYDVAERIADVAGASYGALFARCAHLPTTRDIGAWYRGIDEREALVSLLFAAGSAADPPAFEVADKQDPATLTRLRRALAALDDDERDDILRKRGGRAVVHEEGGHQAASLRFPLGGPTRAVLASRDLAKALSL